MQNGHANGVPTPIERDMSQDDLERAADEEARSILHVNSRVDAFRMLDEGKLAGTMAEAEFSMLRYLLNR
jgi:hypothetical protein